MAKEVKDCCFRAAGDHECAEKLGEFMEYVKCKTCKVKLKVTFLGRQALGGVIHVEVIDVKEVS